MSRLEKLSISDLKALIEYSSASEEFNLQQNIDFGDCQEWKYAEEALIDSKIWKRIKEDAETELQERIQDLYKDINWDHSETYM